MTPRRWMKTILKEAAKEQIEMPWSRTKRATQRVAKTPAIQAAE